MPHPVSFVASDQVFLWLQLVPQGGYSMTWLFLEYQLLFSFSSYLAENTVFLYYPSPKRKQILVKIFYYFRHIF